MAKDDLTTEWIRKKFRNNFDLCSFSIGIGRNLVLGGGNQGTLGDLLELINRRAEEDREHNALRGVSVE
ncbi:MAG: hypothetical protein JSS32_07505 [Verrucomicrobia bacterium]|nr:hypothetical protein [Verrucomicrobiota bacterium]